LVGNLFTMRHDDLSCDALCVIVSFARISLLTRYSILNWLTIWLDLAWSTPTAHATLGHLCKYCVISSLSGWWLSQGRFLIRLFPDSIFSSSPCPRVGSPMQSHSLLYVSQTFMVLKTVPNLRRKLSVLVVILPQGHWGSQLNSQSVSNWSLEFVPESSRNLTRFRYSSSCDF
jgi:hypothetical protein